MLASVASRTDVEHLAQRVAQTNESATAGFARMIDELAFHDGDVHVYFRVEEVLLLVLLLVLAHGMVTT